MREDQDADKLWPGQPGAGAQLLHKSGQLIWQSSVWPSGCLLGQLRTHRPEPSRANLHFFFPSTLRGGFQDVETGMLRTRKSL
ncbi:hypothetical protein VUR80DRAFT_2610 [Thermomyces stellatus]